MVAVTPWRGVRKLKELVTSDGNPIFLKGEAWDQKHIGFNPGSNTYLTLK